jgi:hypothetical protein
VGLLYLYYIKTWSTYDINHLKAELSPICHLLILLGDLKFMGPCIVSIFQYTRISNKMQRYTIYLYLETALYILDGTSTHHQERIHLYLQHLLFVTPLLLSAAIVEELEHVSVCCGWLTPPTAHSNADDGRKYDRNMLGVHYILHISRIRVNHNTTCFHMCRLTVYFIFH